MAKMRRKESSRERRDDERGAKRNKMGQMYIHLWPYTKKTRLINSSQKRTRT